MPEKIVFRIPDMHCPNCAMRLESLEDELPGIHQIEASYRNQRLTVAYDPELIDRDRIIDAVRAKGYHPELG